MIMVTGVISEIIDTNTADKVKIAETIDKKTLEITAAGYEILDITNEFSENSKILIQYRKKKLIKTHKKKHVKSQLKNYFSKKFLNKKR